MSGSGGVREPTRDGWTSRPTVDMLTDHDFRAFYERHFAMVQAFCLRRLPVADANEVLVDVFVAAWQRFDDRPAGDSERGWLLGISRHKVLHAQRGFARRRRLRERAGRLHFDAPTGPETEMVDAETRREIRDELDRLSAPDREVIELSVWEELSAREIADVVGISVAAAEKRLARARRKLAASFDRSQQLGSLMNGGGA